MNRVRQPAVAGIFYPEEPGALRCQIEGLLREARPSATTVPKAIIAPHAGYIYSGPVAASAYASFDRCEGRVERVVVAGPSHRVAFFGIATSSARAFRTPLGDIPVDQEALEGVKGLPQLRILDQAHQLEHSLEVHLPFLQVVLGEFSLVPLVVGDASPVEVAEVLDRLWGGPETLVVISTDLSHYRDWEGARGIDASTSRAIVELRPEAIGPEEACGSRPLNGLLHLARQRGLAVEAVDLRNSGDTAGSRDRVVGYGAFVLH